MVKVKRIYETPNPDDGKRYLVERLWPRGVSRESAQLSGWLKELAPSSALRQWFNHDPRRWGEFQERYKAELGRPEREVLLRPLAAEARTGAVTLVFAARDTERNSAVVLKELLEGSDRGQAAYAPEWLCQEIVQDSSDAVVFADREGVIRLWNARAEAIFGYRAEEALGQTLDLIIPENLRGRHWQGYRTAMAAGMTRYQRGELLAVPAVRKDGTRISLEFTIALLRDELGEILGPVAVIRDVTERWVRERALRERLAALEAQVREREPPSPP